MAAMRLDSAGVRALFLMAGVELLEHAARRGGDAGGGRQPHTRGAAGLLSLAAVATLREFRPWEGWLGR